MASAASPSNSNEVDYYLNPTELFRWINYRRWDGAKSRALSHPEECSTWIVSKHNSDGRVLWRHLPLHLICMQKEAAYAVSDDCDVQTVVASRQMEQLVDVLLDCYPEAASSPDDQGMLPLHLLLSKADGEPNDRIINILLSSFPNAVDVRDRFGRTPLDTLRESCGNGEHTSDRCRAAFRALKRARHVSDKISATIRDESSIIVAGVQREASNERGASHTIIVRLEEELCNCRKELVASESGAQDLKQEIHRLNGKISSMEGILKDANNNLEVTRKERDELLVGSESMRSQFETHNDVVDRVRRETEQTRLNDLETISLLKSELSTSKAVAEALETQLRSKFTSEEYLSTTVSDLEEQMEELKVRHEHMAKKNEHEIESLSSENKRLKSNAEELTRKNIQLRDKLKDLNKQMSSIISSYSALNSEHDRLLELSQTYENKLLETARSERSQLVEHLNKQRESLEKTFADQERIIEESLICQDKLITNVKSERMRGRGTVEKLRNEFNQLRAAAAERERAIHVEELAANRKMKRDIESNPPILSSRRSEIDSMASSSPGGGGGGGGGESRNPHPSYSQQRSPRLPSIQPSADGHLIRLLDERAAAQSTRDNSCGISNSSSTIDSSAQAQHYKNLIYNASSNGKNHPPFAIRRDGHGERSSMMLSNSISTGTYNSRAGGGEGYSLDQYSQDASETTGRYECSSSSTNNSIYSTEHLHPWMHQR